MSKLFQNLEKFKNKIALIGPEEKEYSYNKILTIGKDIKTKVKNKSLILIIAGNNVESIIGYVAFMRSNNVSILLDENFKFEYIKKIIKKYKPNYIFGPNKYFDKMSDVNEILSLHDYNLVKTNYKTHKKINNKNLLLLTTSGTTQSPKFVRLSNSNLQSNANSIIKYLKIKSSHVAITTMPMSYSYGLSIINTHISVGSKIIVNNQTIFEKNFWNKINKQKVTSLNGVPQFYEFLKKLSFKEIPTPHLKYLTQAGGKLDIDSLKYFEKTCKEKDIKFIVMYGQTEASPRMSYLMWNKFSEKIESIGKALDGSKFEILSKTGKQIKTPFSTGELIYFGKNVSLGYAENLEDLNKGDINKGKLFTGDLAYKDNKNYYYIVGRKNRISKVFGIRLDLNDIEKQLKKNNYKIKCIPDNKYLKILVIKSYNIDKIKKIIQTYYGINKNFIYISKVKRFASPNYFKEMIKLN